MNYTIAIPSLGRVKEIQEKTLCLLKKNEIDKSNIYIFVVEEEASVYRDSLNGYNVIVGERGIANQRNFIYNYFDKDSYIVCLDDDIEEILYLQDGKLSCVGDIKIIFDMMLNYIDTSDINLCGVYPCANGFFMKDKITTDLRFCIGGFYIVKNKKLMLDTEIKSKEDYENTILYWLNDTGVIRFNNIAFKSKKHAVGGLGKDRLMMNVDDSVYLVEKYTEYITHNPKKDGEVKFVKFKNE